MRFIIIVLCILGLVALSRAINKKRIEKQRQNEAKRKAEEQAKTVANAARLRAEWRQQQIEAQDWTHKKSKLDRERTRYAAETKTVIPNSKRDDIPTKSKSTDSTYKIDLTISIKSSADKKSPFFSSSPRELSADEKLFLENAAKQLEEEINSLKPFNQIDFSPPSDGDEVVYLPVEGTFNKRFFTRLFLLRNHIVANEIASEFDMVQYQIPVKASNAELILLIYGDHLLEGVYTPQEELEKPIGKSLCSNTDSTIKRNFPVVGIPFSVWDFRDEGDRRTAVLVSPEYRQFEEQVQRIYEWIDENFQLASAEYSQSEWNMVKWVNEYKLFSLVRFWYPDTIFQYAPDWLAGQSLDMFVPSLNAGIEYQGKQHFEAVDYFGGEEKLKENALRDKNKAFLCEKNDVTLYEWPYTKMVTFSAVMEQFGKESSDAEKILNGFASIPVLDVLLKKETHTQVVRKEKRVTKAEKHPQSIIRSYNRNGSLVGEYSTIMQASEATGVSSASIQKCLAGERKTAADLIWIREEWDSEPCSQERIAQILDNSKILSGTRYTPSVNTGVGKAIMQIDPATGEVIKAHESISSAAKAVGINSKGIHDVLRHKQRTAGGFYWQLIEENIDQ